MYWNCTFSQKDPRVSLPQSGRFDAERATYQQCVGTRSAGHNLHILLYQLQAFQHTLEL